MPLQTSATRGIDKCAQQAYVVRMDELEAHNVKFPKQLWADAKAIADARYEKMSEVLRRKLVEYVQENQS